MAQAYKHRLKSNICCILEWPPRQSRHFRIILLCYVGCWRQQITPFPIGPLVLLTTNQLSVLWESPRFRRSWIKLGLLFRRTVSLKTYLRLIKYKIAIKLDCDERTADNGYNVTGVHQWHKQKWTAGVAKAPQSYGWSVKGSPVVLVTVIPLASRMFFR